MKMSGFLFRLATVACLLYFFVLFLCTDKNKTSKSLIEDVYVFDDIIAKLEQQNAQHRDIQSTLLLLKEKFRVLTFTNQNLENKLKQCEIVRNEETVDEAIEKDEFLLTDEILSSNQNNQAPSMKEEMLKKRIKNDAKELLYSFETQMSNLKLPQKKRKALEIVTEQQIGMLVDIEDLINLNEDWRIKEAKSLQELVQKKIHYAQNPENCSKARKLVCTLIKNCGFGCHLHHITYCLMVAYGNNRTLILSSKGWRYNHKGWDEIFQPLSDTCTKYSSSFPISWNGDDSDTLEILMPPVDGIQNPSRFVPLGIPQEIASRLKRLHGNPGAWWVGQFVKYLFRAQGWLKTELQKYEKHVDFRKPIVGVHIRRTDKLFKEAAKHEVYEYMKHVQAWYDKYDMKHHKSTSEKIQRQVYLATDEPLVVDEARKTFKDYKFINFASISKTAFGTGTRITPEGLIGIVVDIHMLSICNYLVCTFSSQVCRSSYELMQTYHPDASDSFHSLDDIYYFGGMSEHTQKAIYDHIPEPDSKEIELKVGDIIGVAGNHWDGFSKGRNLRTKKEGLYPSWKVEEIIREVQYPTYPGPDWS